KLFGYEEGIKLRHLSDLDKIFTDPIPWKEWVGSIATKTSTQRFSVTPKVADSHSAALEVTSKELILDGADYVILSFNQRSKKIELENKFRDNNNFLQNLIEQVPGGIYQLAIDSDGKISFPFLSKGISQTLGLELEEISNFTNISMAISRIHPDDLSRVI